MKKISNLTRRLAFRLAILFFVFNFISTELSAQERYYWSDQRQIYLQDHHQSMVVIFKEALPTEAQSIQHPDVSSVEIHANSKRIIIHFNRVQTSTTQAITEQLNLPSNAIKLSSYGQQLEDGFVIYPTDKLLLKLRKDVTLEELNASFRASKATIIQNQNQLVSLSIEDVNQSFLLANTLYEQAKVEWAHPDFYAPIKHHLTPSDTYYPNQFQMNNSNDIDCDAPEAWDISRGDASIRVAVIDDGLESHPDLGNLNTSRGYSPANNGNGTPNASGAHGVACAGIIGASHNGVGVAGVAPNVEMFSVNIFLGGESSADLANAITYSKNQGADVLSNSWGFSSCNYSVDVLNSALADARNNGRNGKGCIIVFASGNDSYSCVSYPGNNTNVIAVGAITNTGYRSSYSNQGTRLDISAPSNGGTLGVYTTDRQGSSGYASGSYTATFGGTSAACPLVSGVAALVLSVNTSLTSTQVQDILETTADDMGSSGFDVQFGHGRVNAYQAIIAAGGNSGGGGGNNSACVDSDVSFTLLTDNYGSETSWTLTNTNGTVVESGSGYANNQTYTFNWSLADDDYTFTINDSYGDGICCTYGQGSYTLTDANGDFLTGGDFGTNETTDFCVEAANTGGGNPCPLIDLAAATVNSYGNAQDNGSGSANSSYLMISNNAWKSIALNYNVTANTVLEFDFGSTDEGEIHGIGLDNDNGISNNYTFRLYGSQNWGIGNFDNYANSAGSWKSYAIPIGQFYTGNFDRLFFVCDDDAGNAGNSYYRNIKIYEGSCANSNFTPTLYDQVDVLYGTELEKVSQESSVLLYPNPAYDQLTIQFENKTSWTSMSIIDATGRTVWDKQAAASCQLDITAFPAGIYNLLLSDKNGAVDIYYFIKR